MTALEIGLIVAIKGGLVVVLTKLGWWPDWEKRALKREEHKRVVKAYEAWCEQTGQRPAADHEALAKLDFRRRGY
jgi:hypothetical protein